MKHTPSYIEIERVKTVKLRAEYDANPTKDTETTLRAMYGWLDRVDGKRGKEKTIF